MNNTYDNLSAADKKKFGEQNPDWDSLTDAQKKTRWNDSSFTADKKADEKKDKADVAEENKTVVSSTAFVPNTTGITEEQQKEVIRQNPDWASLNPEERITRERLDNPILHGLDGPTPKDSMLGSNVNSPYFVPHLNLGLGRSGYSGAKTLVNSGDYLTGPQKINIMQQSWPTNTFAITDADLCGTRDEVANKLEKKLGIDKNQILAVLIDIQRVV